MEQKGLISRMLVGLVTGVTAFAVVLFSFEHFILHVTVYSLVWSLWRVPDSPESSISCIYFCSLFYSQDQAWRLPIRCSVNQCWMNEWVNKRIVTLCSTHIGPHFLIPGPMFFLLTSAILNIVLYVYVGIEVFCDPITWTHPHTCLHGCCPGRWPIQHLGYLIKASHKV